MQTGIAENACALAPMKLLSYVSPAPSSSQLRASAHRCQFSIRKQEKKSCFFDKNRITPPQTSTLQFVEVVAHLIPFVCVCACAFVLFLK